MAETLRKMRANSELFEMVTGEMAHSYRVAYLALTKEGFTNEQAMALILRKGPLLAGDEGVRGPDPE